MKTVIIERVNPATGARRTLKITADDVSKENVARIVEHVRRIEAGEAKVPRSRATAAQERGHLMAKHVQAKPQ